MVLGLNPGYEPSDTEFTTRQPLFVDRVRTNLTLAPDAGFYYFQDGLEDMGGARWWGRKVKELRAEGASPEALAQRLLVVEYVPYHSKTYGGFGPPLPSQVFGFDLVRSQIGRGSTIVVFRSASTWFDAVPQLRDEQRLTASNPRNPSLSTGNLGAEGFAQVLARLGW